MRNRENRPKSTLCHFCRRMDGFDGDLRKDELEYLTKHVLKQKSGKLVVYGAVGVGKSHFMDYLVENLPSHIYYIPISFGDEMECYFTREGKPEGLRKEILIRFIYKYFLDVSEFNENNINEKGIWRFALGFVHAT